MSEENERKGQMAKAIIENPVWQETWDTIERELWYEFQSAAPGDAEALTDVAQRRWALGVIRAELERVMAQPLFDALNRE